MDCIVSSSEVEFEFLLIKKQITSIHEASGNETNGSRSQYDDEVRGTRNRKNRIIDGDSQMLHV